MTNPTEQTIDPEKMGVRCDICETDLIGYSNWVKHWSLGNIDPFIFRMIFLALLPSVINNVRT